MQMAEQSMREPLNEFERRVLGCLLEKQMTQPDVYPMTENSLVTACNQKQNRDPVMDLDPDGIYQALESLRESGLVTVVLPGPGARTRRFKHEVEAVYAWQKRERAIMTELLLRGPQTPGELRTRCNRFIPFDTLESVTIVLDCLAQADPPWVKPMPREPGQAATRFTHLLYPPDEAPVVSRAAVEVVRPAGHAPSPSVSLQQEVINLQAEVAALTARVAALEAQIGGGTLPS
jgi:uncharacterized protein YceH (UPF0502 family)